MSVLSEKVAEFPADTPEWQVADALNLPDGEANGYAWIPLSCAAVRDALLASGEWLTLKHAQGNLTLTQAVREAAEILMDAATLQVQVDLPNPDYRAVVMATVATLVTAGLLSQATADAVILAQGRRPLSWSEANGILVDARAVGLTRGGN